VLRQRQVRLRIAKQSVFDRKVIRVSRRLITEIMKSTLTYILLFIGIISTNAQTFVNSTFQSNYIDNAARLSAVDVFGNGNYDGIGKGFFLEEMPNTVISSHFAKQAPRGIYNPLYGNLQLISKTANTPLEVQIQGSQQGEGQATLGSFLNKKIKKTHWRFNTFVDGYTYQGNLDRNDDNFLDLENRKKLIAKHQASVNVGRFSMSLAGHYVNSEMIGGSTSFDKETDLLTSNRYGYGHEITNAGFSASSSIRLSKSEAATKRQLRFRVNGLRHEEMNFYGRKGLNGKEDFLNAAVAYHQNSILSAFSIGGLYRTQNIETSFQTASNPLDSINYNIVRWSGFTSFDTYLNGRVQLKSGLRVDYEQEQLEWYPRLQLTVRLGSKYQQNGESGYISGFVSREKRLSLGHFEYKNYLNSSRRFSFDTFEDNYDRGWVAGVAYALKTLRIEPRGMSIPIYIHDTKVVWRTTILNEHTRVHILPSTTFNPGVVNFHRNENIWTNSLLEFSTRVKLQQFNGIFLFRVNDIGQNDVYLVPRTAVAAAGSYRFNYGVSTSLAWFHQGRQRLDNNTKTIRNNRWDWKCSFDLNEIWSNYFSDNAVFLVGVNNAGDSRQQALASGVEDPFGDNFDAANVWGNQVGFQFYGGLKFTF
jgi:hypothetical protein